MVLSLRTSSVAISVVFLFLFSSSGVVNSLLAKIGVDGPAWFADPRGIIHLALGALGVDNDAPPAALADTTVGGLSLWDWISGPSVAMTAVIALVVWTTAGTFMLMFLAALQDIPRELYEAAAIDGATPWQQIRHLTIPLLSRTTTLVILLQIIASLKIFDQVYLMTSGGPGTSTQTALVYITKTGFTDYRIGAAAAASFMLFVVILVIALARQLIERAQQKGA